MSQEPSFEAVSTLPGVVILEFGTDWCGYCRAAQPYIAEALARFPHVRRITIEDGPGRPLGRKFRVKLWPTLVVLKEGVEVSRSVRPTCSHDILLSLEQAFR